MDLRKLIASLELEQLENLIFYNLGELFINGKWNF